MSCFLQRSHQSIFRTELLMTIMFMIMIVIVVMIMIMITTIAILIDGEIEGILVSQMAVALVFPQLTNQPVAALLEIQIVVGKDVIRRIAQSILVDLSNISIILVARIIRKQHPRPFRFRLLSDSSIITVGFLHRKLEVRTSREVVAHIVLAAACVLIVVPLLRVRHDVEVLEITWVVAFIVLKCQEAARFTTTPFRQIFRDLTSNVEPPLFNLTTVNLRCRWWLGWWFGWSFSWSFGWWFGWWLGWSFGWCGFVKLTRLVTTEISSYRANSSSQDSNENGKHELHD
jgi:hypothetical protein